MWLKLGTIKCPLHLYIKYTARLHIGKQYQEHLNEQGNNASFTSSDLSLLTLVMNCRDFRNVTFPLNTLYPSSFTVLSLDFLQVFYHYYKPSYPMATVTEETEGSTQQILRIHLTMYIAH